MGGRGCSQDLFFSFSPFYQNPCEASSRSRIFLFSLVNMWLCLSVCTAPFGHKEKRYRPEIWYTHSPRPYLKTSFFLFFSKKVTLRDASLEKLLRHVDISSIALPPLFNFYFLSLILLIIKQADNSDVRRP